MFTGTKPDGSTVSAAETTNSPHGQYQTFNFTGFDNLQSLTFTGNGGYSLFDNIVVNSPATPAASAAPEPSQFAGLGFAVLGVDGLVLRARKRKMALGAS